MSLDMTRETTKVADEERFLVFRLGNLRFAMPLLKAKEVMAPKSTTPIPGVAKHIKGIFNLRGKVITLVDLRIKLALKPEPTKSESFIILDHDELSFGIIVDDVETVLLITKDQIEMADGHEKMQFDTNISSFAKVDNKLILIFDIENLIEELKPA